MYFRIQNITIILLKFLNSIVILISHSFIRFKFLTPIISHAFKIRNHMTYLKYNKLELKCLKHWVCLVEVFLFRTVLN